MHLFDDDAVNQLSSCAYREGINSRALDISNQHVKRFSAILYGHIKQTKVILNMQLF